MNSEKKILQQLLDKPSWTQEERNWILQYLQQSDTPQLRHIMLEKFSANIKEGSPLPQELSQKLLQQIHQQIQTEYKTAKRISFFNWKRVAAAAAIITGIIIAGYFINSKNAGPASIVKTTIPKTDVAAPKGNTAVITLGNGQQIILDSAGSGTLATQGNVNVIKTTDGQIVYNGTANEVLFNTLTNPRGSKPITLTLIDGSKVWLNTESSLRYPTSFSGNERQVEITGEAYFEVAKNTTQPFKVNIAGKGMVEVLGTHFNINSYQDEMATKVTLLEGSVKVFIPRLAHQQINAMVITANQQALYSNSKDANGQIKVKNNVDIAAVMAWKNGFFNFDNVDLQTVMRQLGRWYNVNVVFQGNIPARVFGGEMQRDLNLSEVLRLLQKNNIHFKIQGDNLIVTP
ncbi:FecR family protein [Ferruginibacter sp.]|nr:DUF4974 domain-containing protein [Ferruginibacter sp.]